MLNRQKGRYDPHLSFSQARTALRCPRQWAFQYVDKIEKEPVGNMIKGGQLDRLLNAWYRNDADEFQMLWTEAPIDVEEAFRLVIDRFGDVKMRGVQVYNEFLLDDELLVFGYTDAITEDGIYIDHKMFGRPNNDEWRHECELQVAQYWFADHQVSGPFDVGHGRIVQVTPKVLNTWDFVITDELIQEVLAILRDARIVIEAESHPPQPSLACSWCRWNVECCAELKEKYENS